MTRKSRQNSKNDPNVSSERDRCQTPEYALNPLLPYLPKDKVIWEPARGKGYLERALQARGFEVVSGDLLTGQNFFDYADPLGEIQVTNPPYGTKVKVKWIRRSYKLGIPWALLMQDTTTSITALHSLFDKYGIEIIIPDDRIDFGMPNAGWRGSSAQFMTYWFTHGLNIGRQITFAPLHKPDKDGMAALYDRYEAFELGYTQLTLGLEQLELAL